MMGLPTIDMLVKALLDGDLAGALAEVRNLRDGGVERERIVTEGVEKAMARLDAKCTVEQFNLLEIMLTGRAVMGGCQRTLSANGPAAPDEGDGCGRNPGGGCS
jgi:dimethylamine corrinoid protein